MALVVSDGQREWEWRPTGLTQLQLAAGGWHHHAVGVGDPDVRTPVGAVWDGSGDSTEWGGVIHTTPSRA